MGAPPATKSSLLLWYYLAFGIILIAVSLVRPLYNWDIIPYVAAAKNYDIQDPQALHQWTYNELEKSVDKLNFTQLTADNNFRKEARTNAELFHELLPFYRIKVVYISLIYALSLLGVNMYLASHLLSAFFVSSGFLLLFLTFRPHVHDFLLFLVPPIALIFGILDTARLSTPDGLAFFVIILSIFFLLKRSGWLLFVLPFSVLIRIDLIIYAMFLSGYLFFFSRFHKLKTILSFLTTCAVYQFLNSHFNYYGWQILFSCSFIKQPIRPPSMANSIDLYTYLLVLAKEIKGLIRQDEYLLYIILNVTALAGYMKFKEILHLKQLDKDLLFIMLSSFCYIHIHFLLFPMMATRFFIGPYLLFICAFLYFVEKIFSQRMPVLPPPQQSQ